MSDLHGFGDGRLAATVSARGAELQSLRDASGAEWLWQGGPEWPRRAPVLFPIVGRLAGDTLRHAGRTHRLTQHGFARDRCFDWLSRDATGCRLRLGDDAETRAAFPFGFALELAYGVADGVLACEATVTNSGPAPLPFSLGAHPAFAWPLPGGGDRDAHVLIFDADETGVARRLDGGLLGGTEVLPLEGRTLPLSEALFAADAVVLPGINSRGLRYASPAGPALELSWQGYEDLGLWSRPGAAFLCLEPWRGHASPLGWDGEFADKPGVVSLAAGASRSFRWEARPAGGSAAPGGR